LFTCRDRAIEQERHAAIDRAGERR
jgi:hypothetical protein